MNTQDNILLNGDKKICHGFGCFNYATISIKEDAYDNMLMLCDDCIAKFPIKVTHKSRKFSRFPDQRVVTPRTRIEQPNRGRTEL